MSILPGFYLSNRRTFTCIEVFQHCDTACLDLSTSSTTGKEGTLPGPRKGQNEFALWGT